MRLRWSWLAAVAAPVLFLAAADQAPAGYHLARTFALGGDGGWDYLTVDDANHRLFISRSTRVMVVDLETGKPIGEIPDTPGIHGIVLVPDAGRGFTSNGREGTVSVFDLKTLKAQEKVKTGENPDAILYDPASRRIFTMNGRSHDTTAIGATDARAAGTVALAGKPEFAVADGEGHLYINLEDKSEIAVVDSRALSLSQRWSLAPCQEPSGMAFDREHRRIFSGCSNRLLAVVNADTGKVVTTLPIGEGVDANAYDPATGLVFSSNGDGTLTIIHEDTPDTYTVLGNVPTARGARTMALDPRTHTVYLVTAEFGPRPEKATAENPNRWPPVKPGTFRILVVGRE